MQGVDEGDPNNANLDSFMRMETIEILQTACAEWRKRKRVEKSRRIHSGKMSLENSRRSSNLAVSGWGSGCSIALFYLISI
jgi:hypothetical protein